MYVYARCARQQQHQTINAAHANVNDSKNRQYSLLGSVRSYVYNTSAGAVPGRGCESTCDTSTSNLTQAACTKQTALLSVTTPERTSMISFIIVYRIHCTGWLAAWLVTQDLKLCTTRTSSLWQRAQRGSICRILLWA